MNYEKIQVIIMTSTNFRKRRRDLDRFKMDLLPADVFPEDALLLEFQGRQFRTYCWSLLRRFFPVLKKIIRFSLRP